MDIKDWLIIGAVGLAWWNRDKIKAALNPANDENIVNTMANKALGLDNKTASIGTKIYDGVQYIKASATAKPAATATPKIRLKSKSGNLWEKQIGGKWILFSAKDYDTYRAIVGPNGGKTVAKIDAALFPKIAAGAAPAKTGPYLNW